jgi:hypothetical protein
MVAHWWGRAGWGGDAQDGAGMCRMGWGRAGWGGDAQDVVVTCRMGWLCAGWGGDVQEWSAVYVEVYRVSCQVQPAGQRTVICLSVQRGCQSVSRFV